MIEEASVRTEGRGDSNGGGRRRGRFGWGRGDTLLLACGLGLAIGLGEVLVLGRRQLVLGAMTHVTPHVVWMAPVGYAALFSALAAPFLLARRQPPGLYVTLVTALGLGGWIGMAGWGLHPIALGLLALGAGWQAARLLARHREKGRAILRRAVPVLALTTILLGVGVTARAGIVERRALASLPPPPAGAPDVLLIILDTVRAKSLGLYGADRPTTPTLDSLAADATVFERAIAPAPWTLTSHASMFTGRWPHELSAGWSDPLDATHPTLAEVLGRTGYVTAGFVANLSYVSRPYGLDRGFAHFEDFPVSPGQLVLSTMLGRMIATADPLRRWIGYHELLNRKSAGRIRRDFLAWLDGAPERPVFAFLNLFDAHEPYLPPAPYDTLFGHPPEDRGIGHRHNLLRGVNARRLEKWTMTPAEAAGELAAYEGAIAYQDAEIARLLEGLESRGRLANTILVITSDHGEQFGEHGMFDHGNSLYLPLLHVPLVVRAPRGLPAGRVETPVSLRDLPATILELVGARPTLPGTSLAGAHSAGADSSPLREASPAFAELHRGLVERDWYPIARGQDMQSVVGRDHHWICNPDGTEELYELGSTAEGAPGPTEGSDVGGVIRRFRVIAATLDAPPRNCPPDPDDPARLVGAGTVR